MATEGTTEEKITAVQNEAAQKAADVANTYDTMIKNAQSYYDNAASGVQDWADAQSEIQQAQTDFAIEQIEQQKVQAEKDYKKEQSASYVDYKKQTNPYGANAEQMAAAGLTNTGYAESSNVAFYTAYQNRVATARESYGTIIQNYNNSIAEARLANSSALAEIAYEAQQQQLSIMLSSFEYENNLLLQKEKDLQSVDNEYWQRYLDLLDEEEEGLQLKEEPQLQFEEFIGPVEPPSKSDENTARVNDEDTARRDAARAAQDAARASDEDTARRDLARAAQDAARVSIDMDSITALGYGPISAEKLDSLIREGKVIEYEENGVLKYKRAASNYLVR